MKTKKILSSAACIALSIFAASCSTDEPTTEASTTDGDQTVTFTGGFADTDAQLTRVWLGGSDKSLTRATMGRSEQTAEATFSWEQGDYIYVSDDSKAWKQSTDKVDQNKDKFVFHLDGAFSDKETHTVIYKGNNATADDKVTIATAQTQSAFNNTEHFKTSGDCAAATATKATSGYEFNLEHKASYLCFLPFVSDATKACKIKKVTVTSTQNIAGEYTLSAAGLASAGSSNTTSITLQAGADNNGLSLKDVTQANIAKSLYMVVAPETHKLKVEYVIVDESTNQEDTITKNYSEQKFEANKVYNVPVDLTVAEQPFTYKSADIMKDWNTAKDKSPNVNLMYWYLDTGGTWWDADQKWTLDGNEYKGGIWVKKINKIAEEKGKTIEEMKQKDARNMDYTTWKGNTVSWPHKGTAQDNKEDYFFLPALGDANGKDKGSMGYYWTSGEEYYNNNNGVNVEFSSWGIVIRCNASKTTSLVTGALFK